MATVNPPITHRAASGVAWLTGFQIVRQLLQVVSVSILARRIPPSIYGIVGMAILVTNLLETVRDVGTGTALIREREMSDELASTGFWLNFLSGFLVTAVLVGLSRPAARFFHQPDLAAVVWFLAISFFVNALAVVPMALLSRAMEFRKLAFVQTLGAVCATATAIALALAGAKLLALVAANIVASLVTTAAVWIVCPSRVLLVFNIPQARRILSFGLHLTGSHLLNYFSRNADNVLVGRYLGSTPLGYYQMGYMLMTYPVQTLGYTVYQVVYPAIANFSDDHARLRAAYMRTSRLLALVTVPAMLGLAVTAHPFVRLLLGPKWLPVANLLVVFAPLGALQLLADPVHLLYSTQGRTDLLFRWQIVASTSYVLSFVIGLRWGFMGVATCYAIVWMLLLTPSLAIPFRLVGLSLREFFVGLWPTMYCSLVMVGFAAGWLFGLQRIGIYNAAIQLFTTSLLGAAVYISLMLWRKPPVLSELAHALAGSSHPALSYISRFLSGAGRFPLSETSTTASSQRQ